MLSLHRQQESYGNHFKLVQDNVLQWFAPVWMHFVPPISIPRRFSMVFQGFGSRARPSSRASSSEFLSRLGARIWRILIEFQCISRRFEARPELSGAEPSSDEPGPSSAEHFLIAHFWTQPKGAPARGGPHLGHFFSASGSKIDFS